MATGKDALHLSVATPKGLALDTECDSVQAPSVRGEFGVLPGHLPLLAALRPGVIRYRIGVKEYVAAIGAGFAETDVDRVLLLTDMFVQPKDIAIDAVRRELGEAEAKLKGFGERYEGPEYQELLRDVEWAQARIDAVTISATL